MGRVCLLVCCIVWVLAAASSSLRADRDPAQGQAATPGSAPANQASATAQAPTSDQALVQKYCITCHNGRAKTGGLSLEDANPADAATHAELWEKVAKKDRKSVV